MKVFRTLHQFEYAMKLAVDATYHNDVATVGGILFRHWDDACPCAELISHVKAIKAYQSGSFYKRELPCILKLLNDHDIDPECIVIDGYVFLDGNNYPGLGKYLYDELHCKIPIIGVAKSRYKDISDAYALLRGKSKKPLFVTAVGIPLASAKDNIRAMHGEDRIPTLLRRADQVSRAV